MSSSYWLFKDTPAQREDFTTLTGNASFPSKFCNHQWLENVPVCEKAIELLAPIKQYVAAVTAKKCTDLQTKSYRIIAENVKDQLLPAKLAFFMSVAKQIQPFLVSYQTDSPMIPFLYSDLSSLLRSVMEHFVKPALLTAASNVQIVDMTRSQNFCDYTKIDVGFSANRICKDHLSTKKQHLEFRMERGAFLQTLVQKLLSRSPLNYKMARYMAAFASMTNGIN